MGMHTVSQGGRGPTWTLEVPDGDHLDRELRHGRPYEHHLLAVVRHLRADLVVDVGAHVGNHTVCLASHGSRVLAVEPNPEALIYLRRNIEQNRLNSHVSVVPSACGRHPSRATVTPESPGNLGTASVTSDPDGDIEVTTVDRLEAAADLIKIDVEGGELDVLAGAIATLERHRPAIVVESHDGMPLVRDRLASLGYRQVGWSLAISPTFLFVVRRDQLARVAVPALWHSVRLAGRQTVRSVRHR